MRKIALVLLLALPVAGCAVLDAPSRMDDLETKVDSMESRQVNIEDRLGIEREERAYEAETPAEKTADISLSKKEMQIALQNAGYYDGAIDGKFGKLTRKAIKEFQSDKNLKVDGIAGPATKKELLKYLD